MKNAQLSLEFMYAVMILLFLALVFVFASGSKLSDFKREKDAFLMKDVALTVRNEINVAYAMEPGYVRTFELPETLEGSGYSITMDGGFIDVSMGGQQIVVAAQPVNGSLVKGSNLIRRVNGNVTLN